MSDRWNDPLVLDEPGPEKFTNASASLKQGTPWGAFSSTYAIDVFWTTAKSDSLSWSMCNEINIRQQQRSRTVLTASRFIFNPATGGEVSKGGNDNRWFRDYVSAVTMVDFQDDVGIGRTSRKRLCDQDLFTIAVRYQGIGALVGVTRYHHVHLVIQPGNMSRIAVPSIGPATELVGSA
jgi:hypothetical protein